MSLPLYALFPDRYVPGHAVLGARKHSPDNVSAIVRKDGHTMHRSTHGRLIVEAMRNAGPLTRAQIDEPSGAKRTTTRGHLNALLAEGLVVQVESKTYPTYLWVGD